MFQFISSCRLWNPYNLAEIRESIKQLGFTVLLSRSNSYLVLHHMPTLHNYTRQRSNEINQIATISIDNRLSSVLIISVLRRRLIVHKHCLEQMENYIARHIFFFFRKY